MFDLQTDCLTQSITKYQFLSGTRILCFDEVMSLWQHDFDFRDFFIEALRTSPFSAFRFETPAVSIKTKNRDFEFVLVDSPWLDVKQDPLPFAGHFEKANGSVIAFDNLGGDATLIVPCQIAAGNAYAHIAAFIRRAPEVQTHCLWEKAGRCLKQKIKQKTIWLNTAGGGVDWLHVRLDSTPKYYAYSAYKSV